MTTSTRARDRKYRQAALVYLHVGLLYEGGVWAVWRQGLLPPGRGSVWLWLVFGALVVAVVVWGLWSWQNRWFARAVWGLHALRLPVLVERAFLQRASETRIPSELYLLALIVVLVNLAFLARAGWDL